MALTPYDATVLLNLVSEQMTGQTVLTSIDPSDFTHAGETVLQAGFENTLGAVGIVMGRLIAAVRVRQERLGLIDEFDNGEFTQRLRKISFYSQPAIQSGAWNTQAFTNFAPGYDNGTNGGASQKSMYEQVPTMPLEMDFCSHNTWDEGYTTYIDQLKVAMRDQSEWIRFWEGALTEVTNRISRRREAFRRTTLLNYMAGLYDVHTALAGTATTAVDLTAEFNTYMGNPSPALTRTDILGPTYFKTFLEFFVSEIKKYSDYMAEEGTDYHWSVPKTVGGVTYHILRETPKIFQKLILFRPLLRDAESRVMPEIFNDRYLSIDNYEGVDFWQTNQSPATRPSIDVDGPAIPDIAGGTGVTIKGTAVALDYVVGVLFDRDACLDSNMFDDAYASQIEARKKYFSTWLHYNRGSLNDFTERGILFYLG